MPVLFDQHFGNPAFDAGFLLGYTTRALALLLNKQFKEAKLIYFTYKDKVHTPEPLSQIFLNDFQIMEAEGIISPEDSVMYQQVIKIKNALLKK